MTLIACSFVVMAAVYNAALNCATGSFGLPTVACGCWPQHVVFPSTLFRKGRPLSEPLRSSTVVVNQPLPISVNEYGDDYGLRVSLVTPFSRHSPTVGCAGWVRIAYQCAITCSSSDLACTLRPHTYSDTLNPLASSLPSFHANGFLEGALGSSAADSLKASGRVTESGQRKVCGQPEYVFANLLDHALVIRALEDSVNEPGDLRHVFFAHAA